jgi:hypothetical protein
MCNRHTIRKEENRLNRMKRACSLLFMICFINHYTHAQSAYYSIPEQVLNVEDFIDSPWINRTDTLFGFEVSELVTLGEYKEYLNDVKRDSSERFYLSQLPDSSIANDDIRKKYMEKKVYESYPVVGISWDNAMNYCKWKTMKEWDSKDGFVYRLPTFKEWLAAYQFLNNSGSESDLSKSYSDWTINSFDESMYSFKRPYDEIYFHTSSDHPALKRKFVIGNSFHFSQSKTIWFNGNFRANVGYARVGFRLIREPKGNPNKAANSWHTALFNFWGL